VAALTAVVAVVTAVVAAVTAMTDATQRTPPVPHSRQGEWGGPIFGNHSAKIGQSP